MDLTPEENYFLVAVHALSNIVYPVISKEFDRLCPDQELEKIRYDMYEQQNAQYHNDSQKIGKKSRKKRIYLTQNQQQQLFSTKREFIIFQFNIFLYMFYIHAHTFDMVFIKSFDDSIE